MHCLIEARGSSPHHSRNFALTMYTCYILIFDMPSLPDGAVVICVSFLTATNKCDPVCRFRFRLPTPRDNESSAWLSEHAMLKTLRTSTTLPSSQAFVSRFASLSPTSRVRVHDARSYATEAPLPSTSSANDATSAGGPEGPLRPHLGVQVNPNHGLWAFFRKTVGKDGVQSYETLEKKDNAVHYSGTFLVHSLLIEPYVCFT